MKSRILIICIMLSALLFLGCEKKETTIISTYFSNEMKDDNSTDPEDVSSAEGGDMENEGESDVTEDSEGNSWSFEAWHDSNADDWGFWNTENGHFEKSTEFVHSGKASLKIVIDGERTDSWRLQVVRTGIEMIAGHQYELSFWIVAPLDDFVVQVQVDENRENNDVLVHYSENFEASENWAKVTYRYTAETDSQDGLFSFNLGNNPMGNIYMDDVQFVDLDEERETTIPGKVIAQWIFEDWDNIIPMGWTVLNETNGNFQKGEGESLVHEGNASLMVMNTDEPMDSWQLQILGPGFPVEKDHEYLISYWIKADQIGALNQLEVRIGDQTYYSSDLNSPNEWEEITFNFISENSDNAHIAFDMGKSPKGTVTYIDDIKMIDLTH